MRTVDRARHLVRIREYVVANAERIAEVVSMENGKTRIDALSTEVIPAAISADYYARRGGWALRRKPIFPGTLLFANKLSYVDRVPFGVVGIIGPSNYPFAIPFHEVMMGLIAGNGLVVKVAAETPRVGTMLDACIAAGGLPEGLFTRVSLSDALVIDAFVSAGMDKIFFTGSGAVGRKLMAKAAERLIPVSLELSGNDAMIVCKDANIHRAVGGALWAGFSNAGQSCAGVERIFVVKDVYEVFTRALRERVVALVPVGRSGFDGEIGPLMDRRQAMTVAEHVRDAVRKGAVVSAAARQTHDARDRVYYPPTVLEHVRDHMVTMQKETFGPVVAVMAVADIDEAVERANNSELGLTASVWTRNRRTAHRVAARLKVGTVTINDHLMTHGLPGIPWGGFKQSGIGRTHGQAGLEEMTQPRVVVDDVMPGIQKQLWWYPHSRALYDGLLGIIHLAYGATVKLRLEGFRNAARILLRMFRKD
jgi:succinate-semialdehyde dehydrogenase/glutarate-semialdehyde dehydrogenase